MSLFSLFFRGYFRGYYYLKMNRDELTYQMELIAKDVSKTLDITLGLAKILLNRDFQWDTEELIKR